MTQSYGTFYWSNNLRIVGRVEFWCTPTKDNQTSYLRRLSAILFNNKCHVKTFMFKTFLCILTWNNKAGILLPTAILCKMVTAAFRAAVGISSQSVSTRVQACTTFGLSNLQIKIRLKLHMFHNCGFGQSFWNDPDVYRLSNGNLQFVNSKLPWIPLRLLLICVH